MNSKSKLYYSEVIDEEGDDDGAIDSDMSLRDKNKNSNQNVEDEEEEDVETLNGSK